MFHTHSDLTKGLYIATSGMQAQNKRVLLISQNLANASTRPSSPDQLPYKRKVIAFKTYFDKKTQTELVKVKTIKHDKTPLNKVYSPHDPAADKEGFVLESNVKPMIEMVDLQEAMHSHEANVKAFEKLMNMIQNTIGLLKS
jgi:flagellar basal-body rod protein FlgC